MQDPPSTDAIQAIMAQAEDERQANKFKMRLLAAALELVQRAATLSPASDAAEHERLVALLREAGDLDHLNRVLCARIRAGALTLNSFGVAAHLRATTMEKLAIDQPAYAAYVRALERTEG